MEQNQLDPGKIMQIGMGFWASKTLLVGVNMGLFTYLGDGSKSGKDIQTALGLHDRSLYDYLDTLVALGFLQREGIKESSIYSNAPDVDMFLDKNKMTYIGGILEMANNRLFRYWNNLEEALKTGELQNEAKETGEPIFKALYADQDRLREFLRAMSGVNMGNFITFATQFDFSSVSSLCDVGGAGGFLAMQVAAHNENVKASTFDLPEVTSIANENMTAMNLTGKVEAISGDFFQDELPKVDMITMSTILHDWGINTKKMLIKKAYDALPDGGALVVMENIIDNERKQNAFGLMMSLNMLIETEDGFDFSAADFEEWAKEAGFKRIEVMPLAGPSSAVIAYK